MLQHLNAGLNVLGKRCNKAGATDQSPNATQEWIEGWAATQ
jgi:hypothetical protein